MTVNTLKCGNNNVPELIQHIKYDSQRASYYVKLFNGKGILLSIYNLSACFPNAVCIDHKMISQYIIDNYKELCK